MTVTFTQAFEHIWFNGITKCWPFGDTKFTIKTVELMTIMIILFQYCFYEPVKICIFNETWVDVTVISILEK